jgi:hypothetical protein
MIMHCKLQYLPLEIRLLRNFCIARNIDRMSIIDFFAIFSEYSLCSICEFLLQCDKFCGTELHINSSTLEIVRVLSSSLAATTFPLPIYHATTTMNREALRPRNLNVNYLPPPLLL